MHHGNYLTLELSGLLHQINLVGKVTNMTASMHLIHEGSASEFVKALLQEVEAHSALNHEYLNRLSSGELPNIDAALRDYAFNYSSYSDRFVEYLDAVIAGIKNKKHQELIRENLLEEEGDPMAVELEDKPHVEIFADFKTRIGVNDPALGLRDLALGSELLAMGSVDHGPMVLGPLDHRTRAHDPVPTPKGPGPLDRPGA